MRQVITRFDRTQTQKRLKLQIKNYGYLDSSFNIVKNLSDVLIDIVIKKADETLSNEYDWPEEWTV